MLPLFTVLCSPICHKLRGAILRSRSILLNRISNKFSQASVSAARKSSGADISLMTSSDVNRIPENIKLVLHSETASVANIIDYTFDSHGKMLRPFLILLMAACSNSHCNYSQLKTSSKNVLVHFPSRSLESKVSCHQHAVAIIAEMIHTASLIHDDIIDRAEIRRGKLPTYNVFGIKKSVLVGNIILVKASELLANLDNSEVIFVLSTVLDDLIRGEFMQLSSNEDENQRFSLYLEKTYKKTASLMANSCKAVAILAGLDSQLVEAAYSFGRHVGMAFQLLDDVLDFVGQESQLGKPAQGSDLKLGLATGPVLFAAQQFPELDAMIKSGVTSDEQRRKACSYVHESNGIGQTRMLAEFHFQEAQRQLGHFKESDAREGLLRLAGTTLHRTY